MKNKISALKKYIKGESIKWSLEIDGVQVNLTTNQLMNQKIPRKSLKSLIDKKNIVYYLMLDSEWSDCVNNLLEKVEIINLS